MFRSLFSPRKAKFDQNHKNLGLLPLPPSAASGGSFGIQVRPDTPEDFELDERIQSMRQCVEDVKVAASFQDKLGVCLLRFLLVRFDDIARSFWPKCTV